jgi:hypothetical protein
VKALPFHGYRACGIAAAEHFEGAQADALFDEGAAVPFTTLRMRCPEASYT